VVGGQVYVDHTTVPTESPMSLVGHACVANGTRVWIISSPKSWISNQTSPQPDL